MKNMPYKVTWNVPDENTKHGREVRDHVLGFFDRNLILYGQTYNILSILNDMFSITLSLNFHLFDNTEHMADPLLRMEAVFEKNNERFYTSTDSPSEVVQYYSRMCSEYGTTTMHDWCERIVHLVKSLSGTTLSGESGKTIEIPTFDNPTELKMKLQLSTKRTKKT